MLLQRVAVQDDDEKEQEEVVRRSGAGGGPDPGGMLDRCRAAAGPVSSRPSRLSDVVGLVVIVSFVLGL
jgi:hypothetical protein